MLETSVVFAVATVVLILAGRSFYRTMTDEKIFMMIRVTILSLLSVLMMTTAAFAGRPLVTDDTGTQGKGKGQVEVGISFFNDKDKTEGGDATVGVTVGVLDTLDIEWNFGYHLRCQMAFSGKRRLVAGFETRRQAAFRR